MDTLHQITGNPTLFVIVFALLGLMVGSFLNVVIYRLPVIMERAWKAEALEFLKNESGEATPTDPEAESKEDVEVFNLITPGSRCKNCDTPIKPWQNIPIVSYLILGGKCATCKAHISMRYPVVEFITALLSSMVAYSFFGLPVAAAFALIFTFCLIALAGIDYDTYLLPDNITLPLVWLGLICNYYGVFTSLENAFIGAVLGYLILWSVFWIFKLLTGKEGMGYGDFKLLAALGAWLGWQMLPAIIILSSLVGAFVGICMIIFSGHDRSRPIPFGPYLAVAGWIALIWGEQINSTYLSFSGMA